MWVNINSIENIIKLQRKYNMEFLCSKGMPVPEFSIPAVVPTEYMKC
jgi:hypothetical protein